MGDWSRDLSEAERDTIAAARQKAFWLYEGRRVPHRSCGVALAETFNLPSQPYQALRKGGVTGEGECGVVVAGRLILGQVFGDPDPAGPVTPALRAAMEDYAARWPERIGKRRGEDIACNTLTARFADFRGPERAAMCTSMAAEVAELVAEVMLRNGLQIVVTEIAGLSPKR